MSRLVFAEFSCSQDEVRAWPAAAAELVKYRPAERWSFRLPPAPCSQWPSTCSSVSCVMAIFSLLFALLEALLEPFPAAAAAAAEGRQRLWASEALTRMAASMLMLFISAKSAFIHRLIQRRLQSQRSGFPSRTIPPAKKVVVVVITKMFFLFISKSLT